MDTTVACEARPPGAGGPPGTEDEEDEVVGELVEGEDEEDDEIDEQGEGRDVEQQVGEPGQEPQAPGPHACLHPR